MAETKAHQEYMKKYRKRQKESKEKRKKAEQQTVPIDPTPPWRSRRHSTTKPDGSLTTSHLFELRSKLTIESETRPLSNEEQEHKLSIEAVLRRRGELAPLAHNYFPCSCIK